MLENKIETFGTPLLLGIEGGGTHTVALMTGPDGKALKRITAPPANIKLLSDSALLDIIRKIAEEFPQPTSLGIGLAGARSENEWRRIRAAAGKIWPGIPCYATHDLETALNTDDFPDDSAENAAPRILLLSGTGSCAYGRSGKDTIARVGGWGHLLGDQGSGYDIALSALKSLISHYDQTGEWPKLGPLILHRLALNEPNQLIPWIQAADKSSIAALAPLIFTAAEQKDAIARSVINEAAHSLSEQAEACAVKLATKKTQIHFVLAGSVLLKQPAFAKQVAKLIKQSLPNASISPLSRESVWGAVKFAGMILSDAKPVENKSKLPIRKPKTAEAPSMPLSEFGKTSPTEQRNPRSKKLDTMPVADAVELILSEDAALPSAILVEKAKIVKAVGYITKAFKSGGRLFYIGAGTSGRLGVLDASECPPTFRSDPNMVQGIIAGGQEALWRAVEGAEDDPSAGANAIKFRNVTKSDVVIGIAASGRTPFVWGALAEARKRGAITILIALNPFIKIPAKQRPNLFIAPNVGPEILTGSTRLKSGTATKLILNILTTLSMVKIGKVISNLMVDLNPSNLKLRDRAVRILVELHEVGYEEAKAALESSGWIVKKASEKLSRSQQHK